MDRITKIPARNITLPAVRRRPNALEGILNKARAMPPDDALKILSRGNDKA
jgi:hypothetical protein